MKLYLPLIPLYIKPTDYVHKRDFKKPKNDITTILLMSLSLCVGCQSAINSEVEKKDYFLHPIDFFDDYKSAKLMILGTFHFQDAGKDGFKPTDLDILSEKRQAEIGELANKLIAFEPTIVAVEWLAKNQSWVDSTFQEYQKGQFDLGSNEVFQLGYRIAGNAGAKVVCIDAQQRMYDDWISMEKLREIADYNHQSHYFDLYEKRSREYEAYRNYLESLKHNVLTIEEYLRLINSETVMMNNHGWYMQKFQAIGNSEEYPMIDEWTRWYNRNYRIFGNLLRLIETGNERILLIIGSGHVPILKQSAMGSPDTELVEVLDYLK